MEGRVWPGLTPQRMGVEGGSQRSFVPPAQDTCVGSEVFSPWEHISGFIIIHFNSVGALGLLGDGEQVIKGDG